MSEMYNSFGKFMKEAVRRAKEIDDFNEGNVFDIMQTILSVVGWKGFLAIVGLLLLGKAALILALPAFLANPIGLALTLAFGTAAVVAIKTLYEKKAFPLAVEAVGKKNREQFKTLLASNDRNGINDLCDKCAHQIVSEAKKRLRDNK